MPADPDLRPPIPLAAAVMLGLVLGIFGYILHFAVGFRRSPGDAIVFLSLVALVPLAGVLARFAWASWVAVAACVAMPTALWSGFAAIVAMIDREAGALAHLAAAVVAIAASTAGAIVGRHFGRPR